VDVRQVSTKKNAHPPRRQFVRLYTADIDLSSSASSDNE
jgi:hypothetical protein